MGITYIDPAEKLGKFLLSVEKPARYTGGEYGRLARADRFKDAVQSILRMAIAFPDLYEIGMSNQALRILYNRLNRIPAVSCDRAFAPAPDFEALLREHHVPLYGLDTGISLKDLDILCFTLGYELGITGVLTMLDAASIPLRADERTDTDPIVIMGGPCVSNPRPYERFIDAFWIGEAEGGFFELTEKLAEMKQAGEGRGTLLSVLKAHPSVWTAGKAGAVRAIDTEFARREADAAVFPVPSMKVVQHHGAVEIMRGCPNGCRFCHAGIWYRPMRQKNAAVVAAEVDAFINAAGYREISLSSLSSGDYRHLGGLLESLNRSHAAAHISFQLPSLRVSTFSLPILESISTVRKSGLTFAVETPNDAWQLAINKEVGRENVVSIIQAARKNGWRGVKFYFMIGLPVPGTEFLDQAGAPPGLAKETTVDHAASGGAEETEIVDFILHIARRTGMNFNINVGAFVPKPHTPYQWAAQIDEETARKKLDHIRSALRSRGHKVNTGDPFISIIEGVISRGDERVGEILEEAFAAGCRLDAWDEYLKKDIWRSLFIKHEAPVREILQGRGKDKPLPWSVIDSGTAQSFLLAESQKSDARTATDPCASACDHRCGICPKLCRLAENITPMVPSHSMDAVHPTSNQTRLGDEPPADNATTANGSEPLQSSLTDECPKDPTTFRILFSFAKTGSAVWLPHLALIEVFSMASLRSGIPVLFTQGFNPLPKIDFAAPLSIGINAGGEIATADFGSFFSAGDFITRLNPQLPDGLVIQEAINITIPPGTKKHSTAALLWGFTYQGGPLSSSESDIVKAAEEKQYRQNRISAGESLVDLHRTSALAKYPGDANPESYFTVYRKLYSR
ncbi:B12-binding protein [Spirochaetia bacterium]|nr:B12-binding protein [Spirochaetia bacterium]GHV82046.1 B12-binding protein [Spirochaetia bacterium]